MSEETGLHGSGPAGESGVTWNVRVLAAERGIWTAVDLHRRLLDEGVGISHPQANRVLRSVPIRLPIEQLAALCRILECTPNDLLLPRDAAN
ncbi:XRE family transcriptional regulator [Yimella sp. RIT 621]|uniref:helix-turn-helix domain-containing protein n=1 Tax=Yimella sp. RIT 621 TaxID=2510323 RepID=UPI00101DB4A0|nr:helix-turn-helix transcriptional regulator [Yimella sp. RIT 621]RYG78809.1 XRE family transcriptional regulator [Yimella sp. RIT 621]